MKLKITFQTLILLSALFLISPAFSQSDKRLEMGLGYSHQPSTKYISKYLLNLNISAKYVINKNAIRAGYSDGISRDIEVLNISNIGFEHRFFNSNFKLITGLDFCYFYYFRDDREEFDGFGLQEFQQFGLGPVIGAAYNINSRFSIQTELAAFWGYSFGENHIYQTGWKNIFFHRLLSFHVYYSFGK